MSLPPPTERQREVLRAIVRLWSLDHRLPTIREVARLLAIGSTHAVTCHYLLLSRKGLLGSVAMVSRGSGPTPAGLAAIGLPPDVQPSGMAPTKMPCSRCASAIEHFSLGWARSVGMTVAYWHPEAHACVDERD